MDELKGMGLWDSVVLLSASEFGRTLRSNGRGTDHGWGGNYFIAGGRLNGGQVLGHYPNATQLFEGGGLNVGQGRLIPTTSWETVWQPLVQWMGVEDLARMSIVLPHMNAFPQDPRLSRERLTKLDL